VKDSPLVCMRKSSLLVPPVKSRHGVCSLCHQSVWVAKSSPFTGLIWCWECTGEEISKSEQRGQEVKIARPTHEQLLELATHWNRR
jgi:hypothetical protein